MQTVHNHLVEQQTSSCQCFDSISLAKQRHTIYTGKTGRPFFSHMSSYLCYHMLMAVYIFTNTKTSIMLTVVSCRVITSGRRVSYGQCWHWVIMIHQLPVYLDPFLCQFPSLQRIYVLNRS